MPLCRRLLVAQWPVVPLAASGASVVLPVAASASGQWPAVLLAASCQLLVAQWPVPSGTASGAQWPVVRGVSNCVISQWR